MSQIFYTKLGQIKKICDLHQKVTSSEIVAKRETEKIIQPLMAKEFLENIEDIIFADTLSEIRIKLVDKYKNKLKGKAENKKKRAETCFRNMLYEIEEAGLITLKKINNKLEIVESNFEPYYQFINLLSSWNLNPTLEDKLFTVFPIVHKKEITDNVIDRIYYLLSVLNPRINTRTCLDRKSKDRMNITLLSITKTEVKINDKFVSKRERILQGTEFRFQLQADNSLSILPSKLLSLVNDYGLISNTNTKVSIYSYMQNLVTLKEDKRQDPCIILYNFLSTIKSVRDLDYYLKHNIFYDKYNKINGISKYYPSLFFESNRKTYFFGIAKNPNSGLLMKEKLFYDDEVIKEYRLPGLFWTDIEIIKLIIPSGDMIGPIQTQSVNLDTDSHASLMKFLMSLKHSINYNSEYLENLIELTRQEKSNFSGISYLINNMELETNSKIDFNTLNKIKFDKLEFMIYFIRVNDNIYSINIMNYSKMFIKYSITETDPGRYKMQFSLLNKVIFDMESKLFEVRDDLYSFLKIIDSNNIFHLKNKSFK